MSLIHWWPLNGDTQDKITGKSGSLIGGGNVNGNGKIGKCYSSTNNSSTLASCADGISVADCSLVGEVGNQYSFACWFLVHGTHGQYQSCIMSSGDWNSQNCWVIGFNKANTSIACPVNGYNRGLIPIGFTLTNNKWYHLATVYDNGTSYAYLDGELIGSITNPGIYQSSSTTACIGRDQAHGGFFPYNGDINDLRIYDHALSAAEVKELSKALVVHYTFDDILTEATTNTSTVNGWSTYANYWTIRERTDSGLIIYRHSSSTSNTVAIANSAVTSKMSVGDIWTFSCYLYKGGQPYKCNLTSPSSSGYGYTGISCVSKDDGYYAVTFQINSNGAGTWVLHTTFFGSTDLNVDCEMRYMQFEKKDHATPYTSTTRESMLYNETGLEQPHTLNNINLTTDAAIGNYAFQSNSSYLVQNSTGDGKHGALASMWIKMPTTTKWIAFVDYQSELGFGCYNGYGVLASTSRTNKRRTASLSNWWKTNEWNHVVVTMNSTHTVNRCWINGTEVTYGDPDHWTHNNTSFVIGSRYNSAYGDYTSTVKIDDFRLYYTYPGDDKIQSVVNDLYKTKAYITDKGDIKTNHFVENKTQAQVTEKNTFECKEVYEEIYSGYDVLEYIESTGTQYVDTGYVTTSSDYTYELDMTPTKIGGFYSYMGFMASGTTPRAGIHEYSNVFMLGANATTNSSTSPVVNERVVLKGHFKSGAQKLYKNGTLIASNSTSFNHSANTLSTHIFGRNYSSGRNLASIKLYSAKIYEGSTLVRHYIPARRQSDNALGLYDILTNTFYANSGTSTFISGSAITNKSASIYEDQHVSGREIIEI